MSSYETQRAKIIIALLIISVLLWFSLAGFEIQVAVTLIPLFFCLQMIFTDLIDYYLIKNTNSEIRWFNISVAPGTILHEMSHLVAVLITGCYLQSVRFFKPDPKTGNLGYVSYSQPVDKWTVFRDVFVSIAPFFGCGLFLLLVNLAYGGGLIGYAFNARIETLSDVSNFIFDVSQEFYINISSLNLQSIVSILLFYLQLTFAFGASSSTVDMNGAFKSLYKHPLSTLFLILLLLFIFNLSEDPYSLGDFGYQLSRAIQVFIFLCLIILIISQLTIIFSIPLLLVGIQYIQLKKKERIIPTTVTLTLLLLTLSTNLAFNPLFLGFVFLASTLIVKNKSFFMK